MEPSGQSKGVTAAFPPPPPFWKHFTPANQEKLTQHKREAESQNKPQDPGSPASLRALELPPELLYLVPPEPPESGAYSLFGESQSLSTPLPSLQEQGIEQLYPSHLANGADHPATSSSDPSDHASSLLKLSKSLLLNFLEFVGILSINPEQFGPKLENIRNLFINAHHLLNLYRPHQARESLIMLMEEQLERSKEELQEMDRMKVRAGEFLTRLEAEGSDARRGDATDPQVNGNGQQEASGRAEQAVDERTMWNLLDEIGES